MPYILPSRRTEIDQNAPPETAGELNYLFTKLALQYVETKGTSYQTFNDIIGALEGCKLELYRRAIGKYEDQKIRENGDIYP